MIRVNLLPHRQIRREARQREFGLMAIFTAIAASAIVFMGYTVINGQVETQLERNQRLDAAIVKLDKEIADIKDLKDQISAMLERKQVVENLIPHIIDNEWFMDSELLIVGEKLGYAMHEVPVTWHDSPGSTVRVLPTAMGDMHGLLRLFVSRPWTTLPKPHERKTGTGN